MARGARLEQEVQALVAARADPGAPGSVAAVRRALGSRSAYLAAKAAAIAGATGDRGLADDLVRALERFSAGDPVRTDPGCAAKAAIVVALDRLRHPDAAPFLAAVGHVQREPVWGGSVDTAAELRAAGARGLLGTGHPHAMQRAVDLLVDPEPAARLGAVAAIAATGRPDGALALRLKARTGDPETAVTLACLDALLALEPEASLGLVEAALDGADGALAEGAALAVGEARLPDAFEVLRGWWERTVEPARRRAALLALAMLREERAIGLLVGILADPAAGEEDARAAAAALHLHRHDEAVAGRVADALAARGNGLGAALAAAFRGEPG